MSKLSREVLEAQIQEARNSLRLLSLRQGGLGALPPEDYKSEQLHYADRIAHFRHELNGTPK